MITHRGKNYPTIADAAEELGVSAKTLRDWIDQKIIDPPPEFEYGIRTIGYFPPEYVRKVKEQIRQHREKRASARSRNGKRASKT